MKCLLGTTQIEVTVLEIDYCGPCFGNKIICTVKLCLLNLVMFVTIWTFCRSHLILLLMSDLKEI